MKIIYKFFSRNGFTKDIDGKVIDVTVKIPEINIIAHYILDAKILVLPIHGEGKSNTTMCKTYS